MLRIVYVVLALVCAFATNVAAAPDTKTITWKVLVPKLPALKDPLAGLTQDQRFDLETVAWVRSLTPDERKLPINAQGVEDAAKFERNFKKAGIDVDKVLADYLVWQGKVDENKKRVVPGMDGQHVKIAGYLLPLEFSEEGNTEFLLVPYVGACIHVPPPPANQIIFVRLAKKFVSQDLFTPVWLTGTVKTKASSKALNLIDGQSDISVGYHMDGEKVELYKKE